jgi:hypothetical protein
MIVLSCGPARGAGRVVVGSASLSSFAAPLREPDTGEGAHKNRCIREKKL